MDQLADKKRAIFESMLELVKENGFHGTPMSMVAKKAGVAAGTIYHYFDSKEMLICELFGYIQSQQIAAISAGEKVSQTYRERFFSTWMNLYHFYVNNLNVLRFFEQFVNSPYNTGKNELGQDAFHSQMFRFMQAGVDQGYFVTPRADLLGVLAHGNIISMAKMKGYGKITISEAELKQIVQMLWNGMTTKITE